MPPKVSIKYIKFLKGLELASKNGLLRNRPLTYSLILYLLNDALKSDIIEFSSPAILPIRTTPLLNTNNTTIKQLRLVTPNYTITGIDPRTGEWGIYQDALNKLTYENALLLGKNDVRVFLHPDMSAYSQPYIRDLVNSAIEGVNDASIWMDIDRSSINHTDKRILADKGYRNVELDDPKSKIDNGLIIEFNPHINKIQRAGAITYIPTPGATANVVYTIANPNIPPLRTKYNFFHDWQHGKLANDYLNKEKYYVLELMKIDPTLSKARATLLIRQFNIGMQSDLLNQKSFNLFGRPINGDYFLRPSESAAYGNTIGYMLGELPGVIHNNIFAPFDLINNAYLNIGPLNPEIKYLDKLLPTNPNELQYFNPLNILLNLTGGYWKKGGKLLRKE